MTPKIIYLDRCVIDALLRPTAKDQRLTNDLLEVLKQGVESGCLVCPLPPENVVESLECSREQRIAAEKLQRDLSGGLAFKSYSEIVGEETLALVRPSFEIIPYREYSWKNVGDDALAERQAGIWKEGKAIAKKMHDDFVDPPERKRLTVDEIHQGIRLQQVQGLWRNVERIIAGKPFDPKDDLNLEASKFLLREKVTNQELEELKEKIRYHHWEAIPVVHIITRIGAQLEFECLRTPRKFKVSDQIDAFRVAVGLDASDLVVTDNSMAELCMRAGVGKFSRAAIFSIKKKAELLSQIRKSMSGAPTAEAAHVQ